MWIILNKIEISRFCLDSHVIDYIVWYYTNIYFETCHLYVGFKQIMNDSHIYIFYLHNIHWCSNGFRIQYKHYEDCRQYLFIIINIQKKSKRKTKRQRQTVRIRLLPMYAGYFSTFYTSWKFKGLLSTHLYNHNIY